MLPAHRALRHTCLQQEVEYGTHDTSGACGCATASAGGSPVSGASARQGDCSEIEAEYQLGLQMDSVSSYSSLDALSISVASTAPLPQSDIGGRRAAGAPL